MSVDLDKNRNDIIKAWKNVIDLQNDWALFGYEGQTNVLKVVSTGNGGLLELTDELNSGKILYAFVGITNEKANLAKYLLINWQGEGVPTVRKGTCVNHIRDIAKLLAGAHLTLNARTEDDIDSDRILEKLNSIRFAVKENSTRIEEEPTKIGTNYSRVIPSKEINSKDRDIFWKKEEEEERIRIEVELGRKKNAQLELEKQQRVRETQEHSERELRQVGTTCGRNSSEVHLPDPTINQIPKPAVPAVESSITQAKEMSQQRNEEAKQLIGNTFDKAKAIFNQNTVTGHLLNKSAKTAPVKPVRNSITRSANSQRQQSPDQEHSQQQSEQPIPSIDEQSIANDSCVGQSFLQSSDIADQAANIVEDNDSNSYSTIKRSPYSKSNGQNESSANDKQTDNVQNDVEPVQQTAIEQLITEQQPSAADPVAVAGNAVIQDQGLRARALYDYQADDESEITFDPGDIITHIDQIDEGWWQGLAPDGTTYGLFPANYVEILTTFD